MLVTLVIIFTQQLSRGESCADRTHVTNFGLKAFLSVTTAANDLHRAITLPSYTH